jgi:hypothetical protein
VGRHTTVSTRTSAGCSLQGVNIYPGSVAATSARPFRKVTGRRSLFETRLFLSRGCSGGDSKSSLVSMSLHDPFLLGLLAMFNGSVSSVCSIFSERVHSRCRSLDHSIQFNSIQINSI